MDEIFQRTWLMVGDEGMRRLQGARVILFGVGGVGSWCAECLVRSGIGHLTIVDADVVCRSNINRQLVATTSTVGRAKVEAMRERLLDINPEADIVAVHRLYTAESASEFHLEDYDCVIDAIDSLDCKCHLILHATSLPVAFFSSMGAALKMDGGRIDVAEFWKVKGCPLARAIRTRLKKEGVRPVRKFLCVYSEERLANRADGATDDSVFGRSRVNGTMCHTTAIFGLRLAGLALESLLNPEE